MKKTILISSSIILAVNILFGCLLSCYQVANVIISSLVIILNSAALYSIWHFPMKDAFRSSLTFLFSSAAFIEFLIALFMPSHITDNWGVITIVLLMMLQALFYTVVYMVSNKVK